MFHLIICDYLYQLFITSLSGDTRKQFKNLSKSTAVKLRAQVVIKDSPNVSTFRHGIRVRRQIQSGKEKLEIFLLNCCFIKSYFIGALEKFKKRATTKRKNQVTRKNTKKSLSLMNNKDKAKKTKIKGGR